MADELLRRLTALVATLPLSDEATFELLVQAVYGNLAIERPELTIERVREVLSHIRRTKTAGQGE